MRGKTDAVKNSIRRFVSMAGRDAELPVTDSFLLEMADDGALHLKGCRGITVCTPEVIAVTADRFLLKIRGEGLYLSHYSQTAASVDGRIDAIEFGR